MSAVINNTTYWLKGPAQYMNTHTSELHAPAHQPANVIPIVLPIVAR